MALGGSTRRGVAALIGALAITPSVRAEDRQRLTLVSGASGGAFFDYAPVLAKVVAAHAAVDLDIEPTGGSNDNLRALGRGDADLGLVNMGPAYEAWQGRPPFGTEGPMRSLRALFPMYETPFGTIVLKASGLASVSGLGGRKVGVGPAGGPGQIYFEGLCRALGITTRIATGSPTDLARRLVAGEIDAFWYGAGLPVGAFVSVLENADATVFGLTEPEIAALRRVFAYFAPGEIPAGTYRDQAQALTTAAVWNFVVATDRMPEDVAYGLTKAALDSTAEIAAGLAAGAGTAARNVLADTFLPLHPGALRYFREAGMVIPAALSTF